MMPLDALAIRFFASAPSTPYLQFEIHCVFPDDSTKA
jgi:hypothetical protein